MDENEALVGELRRYLSSAQQIPHTQETEQVQALKRDLNLASRVGQQLLMQLRTAEFQRDAGLQEIEKLRQTNMEIARENQRLAAEHGALSDSLAEQETQIGSLIAQLATAQQRANRLARATAAAKALEREVHLLEQIQADLRAELERSRTGAAQHTDTDTNTDTNTDMNADTADTNDKNTNKKTSLDTLRDTDSPGALVARRLAKSIERELAELKLEHKNDPTFGSLPSLTMGTDGSTFELDVHPTDMGTPKHQRTEALCKPPAPNCTSSPAPKLQLSTPIRPPVSVAQFSPITPAHSSAGARPTGPQRGIDLEPPTGADLMLGSGPISGDPGRKRDVDLEPPTGADLALGSGLISGDSEPKRGVNLEQHTGADMALGSGSISAYSGPKKDADLRLESTDSGPKQGTNPGLKYINPGPQNGTDSQRISGFVDIPPRRPQLRHARSHESVLSLVPSPPRISHMAPRMAAPAPDAPRVLGTVSEPAVAQRVTTTVQSQLPVRSAARDKLSQVRGVEIRRPERRWAFTPFRL